MRFWAKWCLPFVAFVLAGCSTMSAPTKQEPAQIPQSGETGPSAGLNKPALTDYAFIAVYFDGRAHSGLRIAVSEDGLAWQDATARYGVRFSPAVGEWKTFRDPSIVRAPDGMFHLVWTAGNDGFGYARSQDLTTWSKPRYISVKRGLLKKSLNFTWAPDLFYDEQTSRFVVSFSSADQQIPTLRSGNKGNFRSYYMTTEDFKSFTPPQLLLQPHPSLFEIDPAIVKVKDTYYAFMKIEALNPVDGPKDGIHYAAAPSLSGPWTALSATRLPGNTRNSEGASPLHTGRETIVYYDRPGGLSAARTTDFKNWQDISGKISAPFNFRHGTILMLHPPALDLS